MKNPFRSLFRHPAQNLPKENYYTKERRNILSEIDRYECVGGAEDREYCEMVIDLLNQDLLILEANQILLICTTEQKYKH